LSISQLLSIQVGLPKRRGEVGSNDVMKRPWQSGIFKDPVTGPVELKALNLAGDAQADLHNHGGPFRAVLSYSAEHYPVWREELALPDLPYGAFGENFTVSNLNEETVCIGDIFAVGDTVQIQVTQPRMPCWKLARRWNIKDLTARVHEHSWGGWYQRVLREGMVEAGMAITLLQRPHPDYSIAFVTALMNEWMDVPEATAELAALEPLTPRWRDIFAERAGERL
jgi:MOSC domain-containing protein YiiM